MILNGLFYGHKLKRIFWRTGERRLLASRKQLFSGFDETGVENVRRTQTASTPDKWDRFL